MPIISKLKTVATEVCCIQVDVCLYTCWYGWIVSDLMGVYDDKPEDLNDSLSSQYQAYGHQSILSQNGNCTDVPSRKPTHTFTGQNGDK